jgi:phosphotransferase system enzyme I (PtsI)
VEGLAVVYDYEIQRKFQIPPERITPAEVTREHRRLGDAVKQASDELQEAAKFAGSKPDSGAATELLAAHSQLVRDVAEKVEEYVRHELVNVEEALEAVIDDFGKRLGRLESPYFREREQDIRDVGRRMLRHLTDAMPSPPESLPPGSILITRELLPSEAVELAGSGLIGIVAECGGKNSHTAILARLLRIPATTGIAGVTTQISPGMLVLVDGCTGEVTIDPTPDETERFRALKREYDRAPAPVETPQCETRDGIRISVLANLGRLKEIEQLHGNAPDGIGLLRTEFLFLEARQAPSFQEQVDLYQRAADALDGRPLVIRTLDLGGDKTPAFLLSPQAIPHPTLALRGLRFSLAERGLLATQLRAIVQVAQGRNVRVLFPMVVGPHDLACACAALDHAMDELGARQRPPVGAMIEIPAALFALEKIIHMVDFVAIGTNDLTQYLLALDRDAAELSAECTPWHPLVLRAIRQVIEAAATAGRPVCVCGEDAGDPDFAYLLVALGVRELSVNFGGIPSVRAAVRTIDCRETQELAHQALACNTPAEVRALLQEFRAPACTQTIRPVGSPL